MIRRYLRHRVGGQSAALAFYLLFMFFPFLIFISALLGTLRVDIGVILQRLGDFLPREVLEVADRYLYHVGSMPSHSLLAFGLMFSVWFPARAASTLLRAVRIAYHLSPAGKPVQHWFKTLLYTGFLMGTVILTVLLMSVSERILSYGVQEAVIPPLAAQIWIWLRFPVIGVVGAFAVLILYALAQDRKVPWRSLWPGALAALTAWMLLSWLYTWYVENMARYSLLYGSIGAVIVLLVWLNMSAMVLIMGAELNGVLISLRKENDFL